MPVDSTDISASIAKLRQLGAKKIWLFGSALLTPGDANDIDLGCEGLAPDRFYFAAGQLQNVSRVPIDLFDLSSTSDFANHIRRYGRLVYDAS